MLSCCYFQCVVCVHAKATMQTYPCGHRVVCRKCFVKTIQMAVAQRLLPLRCVMCRAKILRLKHTAAGGVSSSASQYTLGGGQWYHVPQSASLYSVTSSTSGVSGKNKWFPVKFILPDAFFAQLTQKFSFKTIFIFRCVFCK